MLFGRERPAAPMAWSFLFDIVHHRGQISTYRRPMGSTVPQIYGPSGDEPYYKASALRGESAHALATAALCVATSPPAASRTPASVLVLRRLAQKIAS